jgi:hypothetical protein
MWKNGKPKKKHMLMNVKTKKMDRLKKMSIVHRCRNSLCKFNFGQRKVLLGTSRGTWWKCHWELMETCRKHVGEHIGNMVGTPISKKIDAHNLLHFPPPPSQGEENGSSYVHVEPWSLFPKIIFTIFGPLLSWCILEWYLHMIFDIWLW